MPRSLTALAAVAAVVAVLVPATAGFAGTSNPLQGQRYWVDSHTPAAKQAAALRARGKLADAAVIDRIATRPIARWFTFSTNVEALVRAHVQRSTNAKRSALLVAYYIPGRDCGSYSKGGAGAAHHYVQWITQFANGIGRNRATVILEPDAIPQTITHCGSRFRDERFALLAKAVGILKAHRGVTLYIDAGNPGWINPPSRLVAPLRESGIDKADGFALNVSNFHRTSDTIDYGTALSNALGGAHFVIDTGRNGNGPHRDTAEAPGWCNPPGRALGRRPTTNTGKPLVDACLWIKPPGSSDGDCRRGAPPAGTWWPKYALDLARG